ncbi:DUF2510 domain-containing protein [Pseudolysinimonas sp.]|uniref:DUF2510 domain-containing protein n=1 Tax=Pseudolysinimonas sp. TaxID=2680009 RepID=UPI003F8137F1
MTDSQSGATPAGWYADPTGQAGVRWWDGSQWTAHSAPLPAGGVSGPARGPRPRIPDTTPIYTPYIWIVVVLPLLSSLALLFWQPHLRMTTIHGIPTIDQGSLYTPAYWLVQILGLVIYVLNIAFALLDRNALQSRGVVRPFHWGWAFLGIVYPIGRSIIAYGVARPRGLVPLWVLIGTYLVSTVVGIVLAVQLLSQVATILPAR